MAIISDCPTDIAKYSKKHAEREGEPEFGLVDTSVAPGHPDDPPIVKRTGDDQGKDDYDDVSDICQALDNLL